MEADQLAFGEIQFETWTSKFDLTLEAVELEAEIESFNWNMQRMCFKGKPCNAWRKAIPYL
ncbi:hypothetical protein JCM16418A_18830 [Paenibacillus pini]|uniref:Uncharacterized protein n=2 Tax=Paenibacillus TaxID=44249 RepID=W7YFP1_9BACL|nr:hypothetical protein JCM16418_1302 [Paenibacillus pini JCM 16418]